MGTDFFRNRTRDNGFELKEGQFKFGIRKEIFTMKIMKDWSKLTRQMVDVPSLETF